MVAPSSIHRELWACAVGDEGTADRRKRRDRDGEHDLVEVSADHEFAWLRVRTVAELEVDARRLEGGPVDQEVPARLRGPAREPLHLDERVVAVRPGAGLSHQPDPLDRPLLAGRHVGDAVEELESDPAAPQHLEQRRDDGIAHPGLHPIQQ